MNKEILRIIFAIIGALLSLAIDVLIVIALIKFIKG